MSTYRVFYDTTRLSTAVITKKGEFLQVHPSKHVFESETAWRKHWENEILKKIRIEVQQPIQKPKPMVKPVENMSREELVNLLLSLQRPNTTKPEPAPASSSLQTPKKPDVIPVAPAPSPVPASVPSAPSQLKWTFKQEKRKHTFPPGKYYIGDLCYALQEDIYDRVFGHHGYDEGLYSSELGSFMMYGTGGDGEFKGSDGYAYPVDAGHIGIASLACCNPEKDVYGGKVFAFDKPVECSFNDTAFTFYSGGFYLRISNHGDYEDEYEEEGDCLTDEE
jgi:hypothetical protein